VYLANNDLHVAGASRYGQHLQRMVALQYLCFGVVTVYVPLISTCTERFHVYHGHGSIAVTFLNSIVNLNNSRPSNYHIRY